MFATAFIFPHQCDNAEPGTPQCFLVLHFTVLFHGNLSGLIIDLVQNAAHLCAENEEGVPAIVDGLLLISPNEAQVQNWWSPLIKVMGFFSNHCYYHYWTWLDQKCRCFPIHSIRVFKYGVIWTIVNIITTEGSGRQCCSTASVLILK